MIYNRILRYTWVFISQRDIIQTNFGAICFRTMENIDFRLNEGSDKGYRIMQGCFQTEPYHNHRVLPLLSG